MTDSRLDCPKLAGTKPCRFLPRQPLLPWPQIGGEEKMNREREFVGLARDWLLCRLFVFGGVCPEKEGQYTLEEWLIGMFSYQREMELLCQEAQRQRP